MIAVLEKSHSTYKQKNKKLPIIIKLPGAGYGSVKIISSITQDYII